MVNVVVLGDKSRYSFLNELVSYLPTSSYELGNNKIVVNSIDNQVIGHSPAQLPIATNVIFPPDYDDLNEYLNKISSVLYFEEFEFQKYETMETLKMIRNIGLYPLTIVLYIPPRSFLESDISNYDDAISNAKSNYNKMGYSVIKYIPTISFSPLIIQVESDIDNNMHRNSFLRKIADIKSDIYDNLQLNYELAMLDGRNQLSEIEKKRIIAYDEHEFSNTSLETIYFNRTKRIIFETNYDEFIEPLLLFYKKTVKDISFCKLEKDIKIFNKNIRTKFYNSTFIDHNIIFKGTRTEYELSRLRIQLYKDFFGRVQKFLQEILYMEVIAYIENRLSKLEKMLTGG